MLVSELIDKLKEFPPDMLVYLQGYAPYDVLDPELVEEVTTTELYLYNPVQYDNMNTEVVLLK